MRRVLFVSPHFPPDSSAGTHRARLLTAHLPEFGWEAVVVTVDPRDYESRIDTELAALVPSHVRVERVRAWSPRWTRRIGIGDLGLRALARLRARCDELLRRESFDLVYITIYPSYPAVLGPGLKRRHGVPFVLDYQDPWVGAWGKTVGGGRGGAPDARSRLTRRVAAWLEPRTIRHADGVTAVSSRTYEAVFDRNPSMRGIPCLALPIGGDRADYERTNAASRTNRFFDPADGYFHLCYVGTLLPLGFETLRALLGAVAKLRRERPRAYARLRLHFVGTGNQTNTDTPRRVFPVAQEFGVADVVSEIAWRVDYIDALAIQAQSSALLMMGSSEHHYTASKLYPGLLAQRPILAVFHQHSSVGSVLSGPATSAWSRLVTYNDVDRAESRVDAIADALCDLIDGDMSAPAAVPCELECFSARALAATLASFFDNICNNTPRTLSYA